MSRVSVLMPVFNGGKYLAAAVESILGQTHAEFEFLVLDDGSTDSTLQILKRYAARDKRLQIVSRENRGLVASLNELLGLAKGPLIARMDADDISLPQRFSRQVRFLQEHSEVVCLGGNCEAIDESGRVLAPLRYETTNDAIQAILLTGRTHICHPTAMMRRESLASVGGYDGNYLLAEDLDLWLRLGEVGQLANLGGPSILKYRFHGHSLSEQAGARQSNIARAACERAWQRRGITGEFKATTSWRPGSNAKSRYESLVHYGWWAWASRQRRTSALYGLRAILERPAGRSGWGLLARSLLQWTKGKD
jgi:glycosyltransferase involved in cell wall biosynthesis